MSHFELHIVTRMFGKEMVLGRSAVFSKCQNDQSHEAKTSLFVQTHGGIAPCSVKHLFGMTCSCSLRHVHVISFYFIGSY